MMEEEKLLYHFKKIIKILDERIWGERKNLQGLKKIFLRILYFFQFQWIYKWRKSCLFLSALIGSASFYFFLSYWPELAPYIGLEGNSDSRIRASLALLFLGLPLGYLLWLFRTHDTLENIHRPTFRDALQLLGSTDSEERKRGFGIRLLSYLRNEVKAHVREIDALTKKLSLNCTELRGINLKNFQLQEANLENAKLQEANLQHAKLQNAKLQHAKLQEANLQHAKLQEANLQHAELQGAKLQEANLQHAELQGAKLQEANLQHAKLQEANLENAELQEANLQHAKLQNAKLQNAKLQNANLQHAELQGADLGGAEYNDSTQFPKGFDPGKRGMSKKWKEAARRNR